MCHAVFDRALVAGAATGDRARLERGIAYAAGFARFLLASATVTDGQGAILGPAHLDGDLAAAQGIWDAVLRSAGPDSSATAAEIARCLAIYGHDH